jgi:hypothetical protein
MKKKLILSIVGAAAIAALIYGYARMSHERKAEAEDEETVAAASAVEHRSNGATVIHLDQQAQRLVGLQTATLSAATQPPEIRAYGRVLDPAPLVTMVSDIASERAAVDASSREYERLKALAQTQNASAKALEAADAAMKRDQIALQAAQANLIAMWGKAIAEEPNLHAFVQSLARLETVLVRLDLPTGETATLSPTGARLLLPGTGEPIAARFLSLAPITDSQVQGEGFLFVVTNTPPRLTPDLTLTGFLELPGEPRQGVIILDPAVVRSAERAWIYLQNDETNFTRREITLDDPVSSGWFVTNNIAPGARLVVTGAQMLLSEERQTQIKLED